MKEGKVKIRHKHRAGKVILSIVLVIAIIAGVVFGANLIVRSTQFSYAKTFDKVSYTSQLQPTLESDGNYSFTTDSDFKVMQITDVHLGGGFLSYSEDRMALNAIAAMIGYEKPDLVVFTGDQAFAVPYIAGTFNNKSAHKLLTTFMEQLGVYYTVAFGNHDTEAYNYYNRESVANYYANLDSEYCLFSKGPSDIYGYGNQVIEVKNSDGLINQALFVMDSNAYLDDDPIGLKWHYDNVHQNQIDWYASEVDKLSAYNQNVFSNNPLLNVKYLLNKSDYTTVKSIVFQHIPLKEYRTGWNELLANNMNDTIDAHYNYGGTGEAGLVIYSPEADDNFFETMLEKGSTQAMFVGHDHLNNFSITYKGIELVYGLSIDYLAYDNIDHYGSQRGCGLIKINPDTSIKTSHENYYQDKYVSKYNKEEVSMDPYPAE